MRPEIVWIVNTLTGMIGSLAGIVQALWPVLLVQLRLLLGWSSLALGVLGSLFPVIPGFPFLILGVYLVGHRDRRLRWIRVQYKLLLRRCARSNHGPFRWSGRRALHAQYRLSRSLRSWKRHRQQKPSV